MTAFRVRDEIAEGRKPTKLTPPAPKDNDADATTIRRFKKLRTIFLAATPFVIAAEIPKRDNAAVLTPPFPLMWVEWKEPHYRVGAHIGWSSVGRLVVTVVISGRNHSNIYDRPDAVHLDSAGRFLRRADGAAKRWPPKHDHERRAYERVYDVLAYLNQPGPVIEEVGDAQYRIRPPEPTGEITTVLVDVTETTSASRSTPRSEPVRPLHEVRGHVRHYKSGKSTWVQQHTRGDAKIGTHIATYKVDTPASVHRDQPTRPPADDAANEAPRGGC
jgi:hypothetical protein